MEMTYTAKFKDEMVGRMLGPAPVSASALELKVGVPQPTLSKWKREAVAVMGNIGRTPEKRPPPSLKSPTARAPEEKLRLMGAAHGLSGEKFGAFLRSEGIHEAQLEQWRSNTATKCNGL